MNSLITDSYLLSITRNPHISRVASRRAFAFAAPRIYSRSTRCANIQYRTSLAPFSMLCIRSTHISAGCTTPATCVVAIGLCSDPSRHSLTPRDFVYHANASDWIFEGWRQRRNPTSSSYSGDRQGSQDVKAGSLPRTILGALERSILNARQSLQAPYSNEGRNNGQREEEG